MARKARDASKACAVLVLLCLLHVVSSLSTLSVFCAFSGWAPPEGYVPQRLQGDAEKAADKITHDEVQAHRTLRAPFRPWRQGIPWRQHAQNLHSKNFKVARTREVLNNSTVVAVASLMRDTKHENQHLRQKVCTQRQEIAGLRVNMSSLQLEAELRDFWGKEFKEVRYVGNDTFVVAYTLRL